MFKFNYQIFFGDYHKYEVGNIDSFVEHTIDAVIENYKDLNESERTLLGRILKLIEKIHFTIIKMNA